MSLYGFVESELQEEALVAKACEGGDGGHDGVCDAEVNVYVVRINLNMLMLMCLYNHGANKQYQ